MIGMKSITINKKKGMGLRNQIGKIWIGINKKVWKIKKRKNYLRKTV